MNVMAKSEIELPEGYRPMDDKEEFMNPRQKEYFRRKLMSWKEEILRESRSTLSNLQEDIGALPIWRTGPRPKPIARWSCGRAIVSAS
jgi:DnaK suppressor protein